ncbi:hypothetical protein ACFX2C_040338 [Malus domestica]
MDRDRKANTRYTWFTHIGYVHEIEEFSLIVKGLHKYIGSSSLLVDVASSLEVLFLHPGVVSLTGGDAQGLVKRDTNHVVGVLQVAELGDLLKEVTDKSIRPTEEFEGQNKSIKSIMRYLPWKHKMLKMCTREQCQTSFIQGDPAPEVGQVVPLRFSNKQSCRRSGSRDSENDAFSIFEKAILLGVWLSRFGERCLFDF